VNCDAFNPAWPSSTQPLQHCCVAVLAVCAQWVIGGSVVAGAMGLAWLGTTLQASWSDSLAWISPASLLAQFGLPCAPGSDHVTCIVGCYSFYRAGFAFASCVTLTGHSKVYGFEGVCCCGLLRRMRLWCQLVGAAMSARTQAAAFWYGWAEVGHWRVRACALWVRIGTGLCELILADPQCPAIHGMNVYLSCTPTMCMAWHAWHALQEHKHAPLSFEQHGMARKALARWLAWVLSRAALPIPGRCLACSVVLSFVRGSYGGSALPVLHCWADHEWEG
jgi:hypothetical protein